MILLALACTAPLRGYWPREFPGGADTSADTAADTGADTGDDTAAPDPWDDPEFWAQAGPLAPLLDLDLSPTTNHWEVWMTTSPDGHDWDPVVTRLAHSFSSLDLMILDDTALVLGGSTYRNEDIGVDAPWGHLFALTTPDLSRWGSQVWEVQGAENPRLIDAALRPSDDGQVYAIYYSAPDYDATVAPEDIPGDHEVKQAARDGDVFVEQAEHIFAIPGLVDPVLCEWDGQRHVFSTGGSGVAHGTGDDWLLTNDEGFQWGGVQVPYCFDRDGQHLVLAQAGGGYGEPMVRRLLDDGSFTEATPFFEGAEDPFDGGCTSPVVGAFQGQWVMFCAVAAGAVSDTR